MCKYRREAVAGTLKYTSTRKGCYMNSGVIVDGTVKGAYRYQVPCILAGYILLPCGNTISIGVNMKIAFPVQYTSIE